MSDEFLEGAASLVAGMTEAPFSCNFHWVDEKGVEHQFTIRANDWADGLDELASLKAILRSQGFVPQAEWRAKQAAAPYKADPPKTEPPASRSDVRESPTFNAQGRRPDSSDLDERPDDTTKSARILQIVKHSKDAAGVTKVSFDLFPEYGSGVSKFKFATLYRADELEQCGVSTKDMLTETPYRVDLHCVCKRGKLFKEATAADPAKYYWDVSSLTNNE